MATTWNKMALAKLGLGLIGVTVLVIGGMAAYKMAAPEATESVTIDAEVDLSSDFQNQRVSASTDGVTIPGDSPAQMSSTEIYWGVIPWNSMAGVNHANGGPRTMQGSIMEKWGVNLRIEGQDMYGDQKEGLIACATEMHRTGKDNCTAGYTHTAMMGDAAAWYVDGLNRELAKLGPEYKAEIIGGFGRSLGEDTFMGPPECVTNPDFCRGKRFGGVQGDGDINVAITWAALNNIPVNPNGSTWDPDALNFLYTGSFDEADKAYIEGQCDVLPEVRNGKLTGREVEVCIAGTCTWTPGDVNVTRLKGGLAKIYSTLENSGQMPNAIFGIRKWNQAHKDEVVNWLAAGFEGNLEVRSSREALAHSGEASYAIYRTAVMDAKDWAAYYEGMEEWDKTRTVRVRLGGSQAFTMDEALQFYGVDPSAGNPFKRSYEYYGDLAVQLWPEDLPSYPAFDDVFNGEYLLAASQLEGVEGGGVESPDFAQASSTPGQVIGSRNWNISFQSGSAQFNPSAAGDLDQLATLLVMAESTRIEIHGHTDNQGSDELNEALSEDRAFAVKAYLEEVAPATFPKDRITVFAHGEENPIESNSTPQGRASNRRVEVKVITL